MAKPPTTAANRTRDESELLEAVMAIASELDLAEVLDLIIRHACRLTGAAYGALGVLTTPNARTPVQLEQFHHVGLPPGHIGSIGPLPRGRGVLGVLIDDPRPLRLAELSDHPASVGLPATHPPMHSFLGVPIRVHGTVFGNLYLCEKAASEPFTADDERLIVGLAAAAGIAVENARLFHEAQARQAWMTAAARASGGISRDLSAAPALVAQLACAAGGCTSVAVSIPPVVEGDADGDGASTPSETITINGAAGGGADELLNRSLRAGGGSESLAAQLFDGSPDEWAEIELDAGDGTVGLLILYRDGQPWTEAEREAASAFATQIALAVNHARDEHNRHRLAVFQDRDRIARDLHDRVIQRVFAIGLGLHSLLRKVSEEDTRTRLSTYIEDLNATINEIRTSIFFLHHDPSSGPHSLRSDVLTVVGESSRILGFEPRVTFVGPVDQPLPPHLRTDVLATLRESLSNVIRHARASAVDVLVYWDLDDQQLTLQVDDDGTGINPTGSQGNGLRNIAARARAARGWSRVERRAKAGTSFIWTVPVPGMSDQAAT